MRVKDAIGRLGEQIAADRLTRSGLVILDRNWRSITGELDIVALDGTVLVFVEVKTRSSLAFGSPAEAIDGRKAARIRRLSVEWMEQRRAKRTASWSSVRYDVVGVVRRGAGVAGDLQIDHVVGAF